MNYLDFIENTFNQHPISKYSKLKILKFNPSKRHPISEGIQFESDNFAGEIFYYSGDKMQYCEMEILFYSGENNYIAKVVEQSDKSLLKESITGFLNESMIKLEAIA